MACLPAASEHLNRASPPHAAILPASLVQALSSALHKSVTPGRWRSGIVLRQTAASCGTLCDDHLGRANGRRSRGARRRNRTAGSSIAAGCRAAAGPKTDRWRRNINARDRSHRNWPTRTEWNVRDADATLIFSHGPLSGGTALTRVSAQERGRPVLRVDLAGSRRGRRLRAGHGVARECAAGGSECCRPARLERSADLRRGVAGITARLRCRSLNSG